MDFEEKCNKIGGRVSYLNGIEACFVNNKAIEFMFGPNGCNELHGELMKIGNMNVCSFDKDYIMQKDFDNDKRFKKLQDSVLYKNHFGIGNFTRFSADFRKFLAVRHLLPHMTSGNINEEWAKNIWTGIHESHLFELSDDVKKLLVLTTTPKKNDKIHMPFDKIFIDTRFTKKELEKLGVEIEFDEVTGVLVQKGKVYDRGLQGDFTIKEDGTVNLKPIKEDGTPGEEVEIAPAPAFSETGGIKNIDEFKEAMKKGKKIGEDLRITVYGKNRELGEGFFETYAVHPNLDEKYENLKIKKPKIQGWKGEHKKTKKFSHWFVLNFLNFINNPEVEQVEANYGKRKNQKRIEKGKTPIPPRSTIKLKGKLRKYIRDLKRNPESWNYGHRFWVRGHYRTLRDKDRYGDKAGRRIWIPPYIKGKGMLYKKTYKIEDKKNDN